MNKMDLFKKTSHAKDLQPIRKILEESEGSMQLVTESRGVLYFPKGTDASTELYIKPYYTTSGVELMVSRVILDKKRCGTFTKIFESLKDICHSYGFTGIRIQSVCTDEMVAWCLKHKLNKDRSAAIDDIFRDYIYKI